MANFRDDTVQLNDSKCLSCKEKFCITAVAISEMQNAPNAVHLKCSTILSLGMLYAHLMEAAYDGALHSDQ